MDYFKSFLSKDLLMKVLHADLFYLKSVSKEAKQNAWRYWYKNFVFSDYLIPEQSESDVIFFRYLARDDYQSLFRSVIDASGIEQPLVIENYEKRRTTINLDASRFAIEHDHLVERIPVDDSIEKAACAARLFQYLFILDKVSRLNPKLIVFFADMQPVEHLMSAYFRSRGVVTATMQHGLYVDYGNLETVNAINYLHQPSEYFLAWGQNTADLISNYHPKSKARICGKPHIFTAAPTSSTHGENCGYISVFLDQKIFSVQNFEMLQIAQDYAASRSLQVRVRFHPSNTKADYFDRFPDLVEDRYFLDARLVVGHTSSLIYEAITLGCRTFRYRSHIPAIELPPEFSFQSLQELEQRFEENAETDISTHFIRCIGEDSRTQYNRTFAEICSAAGVTHSPDPGPIIGPAAMSHSAEN